MDMFRNPEIPSFPVKPEYPIRNESQIRSMTSGIDQNDIFISSGMSISWNMNDDSPEYQVAMEEYSAFLDWLFHTKLMVTRSRDPERIALAGRGKGKSRV
jgi:hypothetical protein